MWEYDGESCRVRPFTQSRDTPESPTQSPTLPRLVLLSVEISTVTTRVVQSRSTPVRTSRSSGLTSRNGVKGDDVPKESWT